MSYPEYFNSYAAMSLEEGKALDVKPYQFKPKQWTEDDVDIKISHCGVCGSCIHTLTSGWGKTSYPCTAGHEIIGECVKAGKNTKHSVGDRLGVGAQAGACLECEFCKAGTTQYCVKGMIGTYGGKWPEDKSVAQGGYADFVRVRAELAVPIPEGLSSEQAAPMMCAGITTYSPLKRFGAGKGKRVGVIGIGGLGHFGLQWANKMGAETFAISHSDKKRHDAEALGVKPENFIIAKDPAEVVKKYGRSFDILLVTAFGSDVPLQSLYFPLLRPHGTVCIVGLPEDKMPAFKAQDLVGKGLQLAGSLIGGPGEIAEMLEFAAKHDVKAWIEKRPMKEISETLKAMDRGEARYRFVMCN